MAGPVVDSSAVALGIVHDGRGRLLITLAIAAFAIRAFPVLVGGGLQGLHGYDDGVYFGGATALVHGSVPYRDFLLLHPPGMVLGLSPFAILGNLTGDPAAFAVARVSIMVLGAVNAVLVALVAGRYNRLAGMTAGALYAVWNTASNVERTTDLHGPQNTLVLLGLLALARSGRIDPRRAALSGVFLGFAMTVQLWQAVSFVVILWWVVVRARDDAWHRLRPAAAYLAGGGIAFGLICMPFLVAAPEPMIRYMVVDQIGRPNVGVDAIDRLRVLEGFAQLAQMPPVLRQFVPDPIVLLAAAGALAIVVVTAWVCPWTRLWAVLALVQSAVVLVTPSFFNDYPSFAAPAATLVFGTALAVSLQRLARRGARPRHGRAVIGLLLAPLAAISLFRLEGQSLPLADLESDICACSMRQRGLPGSPRPDTRDAAQPRRRVPTRAGPDGDLVRHGSWSPAPAVDGELASSRAGLPGGDGRLVYERGGCAVRPTAFRRPDAGDPGSHRAAASDRGSPRHRDRTARRAVMEIRRRRADLGETVGDVTSALRRWDYGRRGRREEGDQNSQEAPLRGAGSSRCQAAAVGPGPRGSGCGTRRSRASITWDHRRPRCWLRAEISAGPIPKEDRPPRRRRPARS